MTRRRSTAPGEPDPPITGVAGGSLGTAANLDDTQVLSTADLQAAAPRGPAPEPPSRPEPALVEGPAPVEQVQPERGVVLDSAPTAAFPVQPPRRPAPGRRTDRRMPALAGLVAVAVLVLVAGAGILSTLDFGVAGQGALGTDAPNVAATAEPATPKPKDKEGRGDGGRGGGSGHGHGGCHGHGCDGPGED